MLLSCCGMQQQNLTCNSCVLRCVLTAACLGVCFCFTTSFQLIFTFVLFSLVALCFCFDIHFCQTSEFFRCNKASDFFTCHKERGREVINRRTQNKHTTLLRTGLGIDTAAAHCLGYLQCVFVVSFRIPLVWIL